MISAEGNCSKCRNGVTLISPGIRCALCKTLMHGECLVPPMNAKALEDYVLKHSTWHCVSCTKKVKDENTKRPASELGESKKNLDMVREIREILILVEDALLSMVNTCDKLTSTAAETKKNNFELKRRIKLHESLGRKAPKNYDEWRRRRKKIEVKDAHKKKKLRKYKRDNESKDAFKKVKTLNSHVKKVHKLKKRPRPKRTSSDEHAADMFKKRMKKFNKKTLLWLQVHYTNLTEGWLIHVLVLALLIFYTFFGAFIFWIVEGRYEQQLVNEVIDTRRKVLNQLEHNATGNHEKQEKLVQYYDYLAEKFGNNSKLFVYGDEENNWSFFGSVYFCATTYTTIGYGDVAPVTNIGKVITIVYALFGIPLFLSLLALLGKSLFIVLQSCFSCFKKKESAMHIENEDDEEMTNVSLWVLSLVVLIYLTLGAVMFMLCERWTYLGSIYFVFITMLTIGFGDCVMDTKILMVVAVVYVIIGLSLTSMLITLAMDKLKTKFQHAAKKLGEAAEMYKLDEENEQKR